MSGHIAYVDRDDFLAYIRAQETDAEAQEDLPKQPSEPEADSDIGLEQEIATLREQMIKLQADIAIKEDELHKYESES